MTETTNERKNLIACFLTISESRSWHDHGTDHGKDHVIRDEIGTPAVAESPDLIYKLEAEIEMVGLALAFETSKPNPSDKHPQTRSNLLNLPTTVPPNRYHPFKYMSLLVPLSLKYTEIPHGFCDDKSFLLVTRVLPHYMGTFGQPPEFHPLR